MTTARRPPRSHAIALRHTVPGGASLAATAPARDVPTSSGSESNRESFRLARYSSTKNRADTDLAFNRCGGPMSRAEPVRALVAASFATAAVLIGACAQGADHTAAADDVKHAQAKSARSSDAGTHGRVARRLAEHFEPGRCWRVGHNTPGQHFEMPTRAHLRGRAAKSGQRTECLWSGDGRQARLLRRDRQQRVWHRGCSHLPASD